MQATGLFEPAQQTAQKCLFAPQARTARRLANEPLQKITPRGVEQTSDSPRKTTIPEAEGAKSGARESIAFQDERLQRIVEAWRSLPELVRGAMLSLAEIRP